MAVSIIEAGRAKFDLTGGLKTRSACDIAKGCRNTLHTRDPSLHISSDSRLDKVKITSISASAVSTQNN